MSQHPDSQLTLEDNQLIEEHQLGAPLSIYRLKASLVRLTRVYGWFALIGGIITIIVMFLPNHYSNKDILTILNDVFAIATPLIVALLAFCVEIPSMKKARLIVCENGFLQRRRKVIRQTVDLVHWEQVDLVWSSSLSLKDKRMPFELTKGYEHYDELIAEIKRHTSTQRRNPVSSGKNASRVGQLIYFQGSFFLNRPLQLEHRRYLQRFSDVQHVSWVEERVERLRDPLRVTVGLPVGPDGAYFVGKAAVGEDFEPLAKGKDLWLQTHARLIKAYDIPPHGQPGLWCDWVPSEDGQYILHNGSEKSLCAEEWLYYLIEHFLRPWGYLLSGQVQWHVLEVGPEQQGTITIENNVIQDFDVSRFEQHIVAIQHGYMDIPAALNEQGQIESEQNVVDYHTKEHPF